jgi:hypothetical protein
MHAVSLPCSAPAAVAAARRCARRMACSARVTRSATAAAAAASSGSGDDAWRANLLTATPDIRALAASARRVAVLGIKTDAKARAARTRTPHSTHSRCAATPQNPAD